MKNPFRSKQLPRSAEVSGSSLGASPEITLSKACSESYAKCHSVTRKSSSKSSPFGSFLSRPFLSLSVQDDSPPAARSRSGSFTPTVASSCGSECSPQPSRRERANTTIGAGKMNNSRSLTLPRYRTQKSTDLFNLELDSDAVNGSQVSDHNGTDESELEEIECLLPNSIVLDIKVHPDYDVMFIKELAIEKATTDERLPLRGCLDPDSSHYQVSYVSTSGRREDVFDENITLREMKPFANILKFAKKTKDRDQYHLKKYVGKLIGKDLKDYEALRDCEINEFRWKMKVFANGQAQGRKRALEMDWKARILYQYPPRLVASLNKPHGWSQIPVRLVWGGHEETSVDANIGADALVETLGQSYGFDPEYTSNCCIKIIGEESFLLGEHRIIDFQYIRDTVMLRQVPKLMVINMEQIDVERASENVYQTLDNDCTRRASSVGRNMSKNLSIGGLEDSAIPSTEVDKPFTVTVHSIRLAPDYKSDPANASIKSLNLQLGIFHGGRLLCPTQSAAFNIKNNDDETSGIAVEKCFTFGLSICQMPRMARLCLGVFDKKRSLFWVNTNVFDYKAKLKWNMTLQMWTYSLGGTMPTYGHLAPLRQCQSNRTKDATDIIISFVDEDQMVVEYPVAVTGVIPAEVNHVPAKIYAEELLIIAGRDPLYDLTEQEKDLIWQFRNYCLSHLPALLPRLVDCVDYANPNQVFELASLLDRWPLLPVEQALQLLDYAYPDDRVRSFAVRCLREATDDTILSYLLQLVQTLKHENYVHCSLVEFLLERALNNQHIGHYLYWTLRSEMNSPFVGFLFGLILEAYLSAAPEHLKILEQQNTMLEKCRATQASLQKLEALTRTHDKIKMRFMTSTKGQFNGYHPFRNFISPLNPVLRCKSLRLDRCKLMNSKMRPQMLAFENFDMNCRLGLGEDLEDIVIMYKKGDDLRQDMLTLQLLRLMDRLWKENGLDLRMNVYRCLSTDVSEGFIEVVQNAETICKIQMSQADTRSTAPFQKRLLLSWLKAHNPNKMKEAQWEFTYSCAGYSVATYILGIGDRHNDNIMVRNNGQLFHIDFGHFLGNFKHKFGIKRERVPIILSSEFIEVIKADFGEPKNFEKFRLLCEQAYMTIRKHGSLIISLLAMMISTGLPELTSEQDLNFIRNTLHLDLSDNQALENFRKDFNESLRNAWTISLDWMFHMMNQMRAKSGK